MFKDEKERTVINVFVKKSVSACEASGFTFTIIIIIIYIILSLIDNLWFRHGSDSDWWQR